MHSDHDRKLVSAFVAGDLTYGDAIRAKAQIDACDQCRDLATDLRAITTGIQHLPAPVRPDRLMFTLDRNVADRLRRGAIWRQLLHPFAGSGGALRPLAGALMTLGIAGLLFTAVPFLPSGAAGSPRDTTNAEAPVAGASEGLSAAPDTRAPAATQPTTAPAAGSVDAGPAYGGSAPALGNSTADGDAGVSKQAGLATSVVQAATPMAPDPARWPSLPWLSAGLIALGVGLLVLRRMAIRVR